MRGINCCLFIFFIVLKIIFTSTTADDKSLETTIVKEQIDLLKAKMFRLRNLKDLLRNSTLFRNWEGNCPLELGSQLRCKIVLDTNDNNNCICWSAEKDKVNWFTADAFCDYYGMNLISFPIKDLVEDETIDDFMTHGIWTSANDAITRRVWSFRNKQFLSKEEAYIKKSIQGLDEFIFNKLPPLDNTTSSWITPVTCISARSYNNTNKFYPESSRTLNKPPLVADNEFPFFVFAVVEGFPGFMLLWNMIIYYYLSPCVSSFVAAMNFVPLFLLFSHQLMALTTQQMTFDLLNNIDDSIEMGKTYYFQDRLVERLNSIVQLVDQTIAMQTEKRQNPPFVKLLKGICPDMLMQEPQDGLKFRCHAFETNDCYCFSHKKATWYRAEAFCRRFRMTLADLSPNKVTEMIKNKVDDPSAVDEKGEWYWTSATDLFTRGQMIWMNTGRLYVNPGNSSRKTEIESCLKFPIADHKEKFSSASCFEENHFLCQKFLNFFPLHNNDS